MAQTVCVDFDEVLNKWATDKLGAGYVVEKIDTSKIKLHQLSVVYQSNEDWYANNRVHEELFDNSEVLPITWQYAEKVQFQSRATWRLIRGFKSSLFVVPKINVEFPVAEDGSRPLRVTFDNGVPDQGLKTSERQSVYDVTDYVTVKPFSTMRANAHVRTCKLQNVMFTTDICLMGILRVIGHKKRKHWSKQELTASIDEVLRGHPSFHEIYLGNEGETRTRKPTFRVEGLCSGEVALAACILQSELQTLV